MSGKIAIGSPLDSGRYRRLAGPLYPFLCLTLLTLAMLSIARIFHSIAFKERLDGFVDLGPILLNGLRIDLMSLSYLLGLPLVLFVISHTVKPALAGRLRRPLVVWGVLVFMTMLFFEAITPLYLIEYGLRPERKFFEYLVHPREVFLMLWGMYGFFAVALSLFLAVSALFVYRLVDRSFFRLRSWSPGKLAIVLPLILVGLVVGMRSSFDHRPINPSMVAFTDDALVNSLPLNSFYSVLYAAYQLKHEANASEMYGTLPRSEVFARVDREYYRHNSVPNKTDNMVTRPSRRKNLVIILEESLGARFVATLGGASLTPNLDRLSREGWWFDRLYATGTRSVRGLEAVLTGFPPTPARSTVKLPNSQSNFFTLASHLGDLGYRSCFYYGGRAHFDNMKGFLLSNGFNQVVEQQDFVSAKFIGSWGASDDDVLARVHADLLEDSSLPKLLVVLTTSNHTPFDFPVNPGDQYPQPVKSRDNAIRYADRALGDFFDRAKASAYWNDSVFLVVADHDLRAADLATDTSMPFPVEGFHIPGLVTGGGIEAKRIRQLASQIDLPPTLLSLIGAGTAGPLIGTDLTRIDDSYVGRAIMQFNSDQAYLEDDKLVVLRPGQPALNGRFADGSFQPATQIEPDELVKTALAHALWANIMYREGRYN